MKKNNTEQILARIYGKGRGEVFTPKDFLDLSSPETARKTLGRLVVEGLQRDYRGMQSLLFGDIPDFEDIMAELADLEDRINRMQADP